MIHFYSNRKMDNKNFLTMKANFSQKRTFYQSQNISFLNNSNQILTIKNIGKSTKRKSQNQILMKKPIRTYQSRRPKNNPKPKRVTSKSKYSYLH